MEFTPNTWVRSGLHKITVSSLLWYNLVYHRILHLGLLVHSWGFNRLWALHLFDLTQEVKVLDITSQKEIVLQIYPSCLHQSHRAGYSPYPYPFGLLEPFTLKKAFWSHFKSRSHYITPVKNLILSLSVSSSEEEQRGHYLHLLSKNRESLLGICGPIYITKLQKI